MNAERIGLIGCGLLGAAIGERLHLRGFAVTACDIDDSRGEVVQRFGGEFVRDAAEVVRHCRRIVLCLPDSPAVSAAVRRLLPTLPPDGLIIDATTGDPTETALLAEELAGHHIGYVDATVGGSSRQARAGEIIVMAGGSTTDFEQAHDVLNALAQQVFHVGPAGSGARMKLVVNLVLGLNRAVLAEGLAFAEACGLDGETVLEVLRAGPAFSRVMETKGDKMLRGDFEPEAKLAQHLKDVRLILDAAPLRRLTLPLSQVHRDLLERLVEQGCGDEDNSAVRRAFGPQCPPT